LISSLSPTSVPTVLLLHSNGGKSTMDFFIGPTGQTTGSPSSTHRLRPNTRTVYSLVTWQHFCKSHF
jgi:hypothetical protein